MSLSRQIVFGISPDTIKVYGQSDRHIGETLNWPMVEDGNSVRQLISCAFIPNGKSSSYPATQNCMFLGTVGADLTLKTFDPDTPNDDSTPVHAEAILGRLDPSLKDGQVGETVSKRFDRIEFANVNPIAKGVKVEVCFNVVNPTKDVVSWDEVVATDDSYKASIRNGLGRWMHMRLTDDRSVARDTVLDAFKLYYYDLSGYEDGEG